MHITVFRFIIKFDFHNGLFLVLGKNTKCQINGKQYKTIETKSISYHHVSHPKAVYEAINLINSPISYLYSHKYIQWDDDFLTTTYQNTIFE